jgi:nitrate/TMAO reductase-like tetraheme cytochrome c subunit
MHMKEGNSDCLSCHLGRLRPLPDDHWKRTNETCLGCHSFDYDAVLIAAAPIAHERTGREACLKCHLLAIERARPMPGEHSGRSVESCGSCHKPF